MSEIRRILVPVDFSAQASQALRYGCALARENQAELYVIHVVQEPVPFGGRGMSADVAAEFVDEVEQSASEALSHIPSAAVSKGLSVFRRTAIGSPWERTIEFADSNNIDLICLGTHGRSGFKRLVLGSVAEKVVQHATCNVLVVRSPEREFVTPEHDSPTLRRILVPTDFSDCSRSAVDEGASWAARFNAELHLLHVVEDNSPTVSQINLAYPVFQSYFHELVRNGEQQLNQLSSSAVSEERLRRKVVVGDPINKIDDYAAGNAIDLIVMGTHGRRGPSRWMIGSVAERVVRSAPCPVLVVRAPGSACAETSRSTSEPVRTPAVQGASA